MKINPLHPAFPTNPTDDVFGMDIRTYLAAKAMQGIVVSDTWITESDCPEIARRSVLLADALIAELSKETK